MDDGIANISRAAYDREARVNWSTLKHMSKSPAHYRHHLLKGGVDSDARKRGRAVHLAVFEPELFAREVARYEGRRQGKVWEKFQADNEGREILTADAYDECLAIQAAVRNHPAAAKWLSGGIGEASLFWTHKAAALGELPGYEMACKGRVDFIAKAGAIVDLKTTRDASPEGFARECWRYRYHTQAAFYVDGYRAATGEDVPFVIVAVEASEPHIAQVYRVPEHVLQVGRDEYRSLLDRLALCRAESKWESYADGELDLELPRWATDWSEDDDVSDLGLDFNNVAEAEA